MKDVLIFLILLSFIVNSYSKCKPNEAFDEQTKKCEKFCEEGKVFNPEKASCEPNTACPKGKKFNQETSSCEDIQIDHQDPNKPPKIDYNKCKGGRFLGRSCFCPTGKKIINGICVDDPENKCKNGIMENNKCLAIKDLNCMEIMNVYQYKLMYVEAI